MADHGHAAGERDERVLEGAEGVDVEVVGGLVEQQQVGAAPQQPGEVHPVALAPREGADGALLVAALEVEPRAVRARGHPPRAEPDLVVAVRDGLPDRLLGVELAALVHVAELDGLAQGQGSGVGGLLARDHAEQGGLAGPVGPDHADDAGWRQSERQVLDEARVAVALAQVPRLDDRVPEPRAGGNVDLRRLDALGRVLVQQLLVGVQPRLALRLPGARRHADPLELAGQRAPAPRLLLLLDVEPALLLLEPRRVVALPRDAGAAVELENPAGDVVEEVAVVGDRHHRALVLLQVALEPPHRLGVEVVRGLVEQQQVGGLQHQPAQRDAAPLAPRQVGDGRARRWQPQRVHRLLDPRVEVPGAGRLDLVLQAPLLVHRVLQLVAGQPLVEARGHCVVALQQVLVLGHPLFDVALDGLVGVEPRFLRKVADADALGDERGAAEIVHLRRHDPQQGALARPVQPQHADLGAGQERQRDVLQHLLPGAVGLAEPVHRVDVLMGHAAVPCSGRPSHRSAAGISSSVLHGGQGGPGLPDTPPPREERGRQQPHDAPAPAPVQVRARRDEGGDETPAEFRMIRSPV